MSQLLASGSQNIGTLISASVLPMNIQGLFPLGPVKWISVKWRPIAISGSHSLIFREARQLISSRLLSPSVLRI